jgi:UDP-glucuronate 4-epimerase
MRILVTGCVGFIGFHLSNKLTLNGHTVIGIDSINDYYGTKIKFDRLNILRKNSKKFIFKKGDISNYSFVNKIFQKFKIDQVVNLAAQAGVRYSIENPKAYLESNLIGFFNILDCSKKFKIKHLIYASTSSVYGNNSKLPFKESRHADHPIQFYAATKRSNELMAHSYSSLYKLPTTGLRFFTVYGPWGRPDMALFIFSKNILEGKKIDLFNYGNHIRDFTYVDDVVEPILRLINKPPKDKNKKTKKSDPSESTAPFKIYNIGNNDPKKLMEFVKAIENKLEKKAKINLKPLQKGDVYETYADTNKLLLATKYKSKTSISKGIGNFIDWFRSYYKC